MSKENGKTKAPVKEGKKAPKKEEEIPQLVVTSKVKELIKSTGLRCAGDFTPALNKSVYRAVKTAMKRCQGNNRSTVREVDAL